MGRPRAPELSVGLNVYLYPRHYILVSRLARQSRVSRSALIRRILDEWNSTSTSKPDPLST